MPLGPATWGPHGGHRSKLGQSQGSRLISSSPTVNTALKTAVFKLHNPSRRKRAMLDHALPHNHLAYNKALKSLAPPFGCRGASIQIKRKGLVSPRTKIDSATKEMETTKFVGKKNK